MLIDQLERYPESSLIPGARLVGGVDWSDEPVLRSSGLGASEAAAVFGVDAHRGPLGLWRVKVGVDEPDNLSDVIAIRHGHLGEPYLLDAAPRLGCPPVVERQVVVACPGRPWLHATLDGLTADLHPVEAKTVTPLMGWAVSLADAVGRGEDASVHLPDRYIVQTHIQMLATGASIAHVLVAVWGMCECHVPVVRNESLLAEILPTLDAFWSLVQSKTPPRACGPDLDLLRVIRPESGKAVKLPMESMQDADDLDRAKRGIKDCEREIDLRANEFKKRKKVFEDLERSAKARLYQAIGDAETGVLPDGRVIRAPMRSRREYTVQANEFRSLTVRGAKL